jgi:hypothetical protein
MQLGTSTLLKKVLRHQEDRRGRCPTPKESATCKSCGTGLLACRCLFRSLLALAPREGSRRIPDVCLCENGSETPRAGFGIAEEDRGISILGVEYVWVIDPVDLTGEVHTQAGIERVADGVFRAGVVEVNVRGVMNA